MLGFVGLGTMGGKMAARLLAAGCPVLRARALAVTPLAVVAVSAWPSRQAIR